MSFTSFDPNNPTRTFLDRKPDATPAEIQRELGLLTQMVEQFMNDYHRCQCILVVLMARYGDESDDVERSDLQVDIDNCRSEVIINLMCAEASAKEMKDLQWAIIERDEGVAKGGADAQAAEGGAME